jgi:hypothetical protein
VDGGVRSVGVGVWVERGLVCRRDRFLELSSGRAAEVGRFVGRGGAGRWDLSRGGVTRVSSLRSVGEKRWRESQRANAFHERSELEKNRWQSLITDEVSRREGMLNSAASSGDQRAARVIPSL